MDNLSLGNMNLTRIGKSAQEARRAPRQFTGISCHAAPSVLPAKGPVAILQSTPVSQASPKGSARWDFSGKSGASEREPQRRGLKIGSMRNGSELMGRALTFRRRLRRG